MGRPHVDEKDKRIVQVNIRLTEDEFKKVSTYASDSDRTPAKLDEKKNIYGKVSFSQIGSHGFIDIPRT